MSTQTTEQRFHRAMININEVAKRDCHYTATYFLQMVLDPDGGGGVGAAKRLLAKGDVSTGLSRLVECGRLDLTVEAHVIKPEFAELFTTEEIATARHRLTSYGYKFA